MVLEISLVLGQGLANPSLIYFQLNGCEVIRLNGSHCEKNGVGG